MTAPVPLPDPTAPAAPAPSRALPDGVTPAFARSVRLWSRAYPRRWRAVRGEELLGLLADLTAPGATRLDARSAVDLVRAGWATRLRQHPPLGPWLRYRLLSTRSLRGHLAWVADDIDGLLFPLRQSLLQLVILLPIDRLRVAHERSSVLSEPVFWAVVVGVLGLEMISSDRTRAREAQLLARPGERVRPGMWVRVRAPRRRVAARASLPWVAVGLAVLLVACVVGALLAPEAALGRALPTTDGQLGVGGDAVPRAGVIGALGAAVGVGALLAGLAHVRLRRQPSVEQPNRELVGLGGRRRLGLVLVGGLLGAVPVAEAVGAVPLAVSLPIGLAAGVLVPPALASWLAMRRPELAELALVDVRRVALIGRPPRVDGPGSALSPARASEIGEVWPWPWSNEGPTAALG